MESTHVNVNKPPVIFLVYLSSFSFHDFLSVVMIKESSGEKMYIHPLFNKWRCNSFLIFSFFFRKKDKLILSLLETQFVSSITHRHPNAEKIMYMYC